MGAAEVLSALNRAQAAQPAWASLSFRDRARVVLQARKIVLAELDEIGTLISRETGKPSAEALSMEIVPGLDLMHYFARHTARLLQPHKIDIGQYWLMGRSSQVVYKPLGVIGIISPWNFPWATPLAEVVMALMAGNSVVLKPSEVTSLTGLKIKEVLSGAGFDDGVLQIVPGAGSTGAALVGAGVDRVSFTGCVITGQ